MAHLIDVRVLDGKCLAAVSGFFDEVFDDLSFILLGAAISFLYITICAWIYGLEGRRILTSEFVFFIGNFVNQPFPESFKVSIYYIIYQNLSVENSYF